MQGLSIAAQSISQLRPSVVSLGPTSHPTDPPLGTWLTPQQPDLTPVVAECKGDP